MDYLSKRLSVALPLNLALILTMALQPLPCRADNSEAYEVATFESLVNIPDHASRNTRAHLDRAFKENDFTAQDKTLIEVLYAFFEAPPGEKRFEEYKEKIEKVYPAKAALWIMIARALKANGDIDCARSCLKEAQRLAPKNKIAESELKQLDNNAIVIPANTEKEILTPSVLAPSAVSDAAKYESIINLSLDASMEHDRNLLKQANLAGKDLELANIVFDIFSAPAGRARVESNQKRITALYPQATDFFYILGKTLEALGDKEAADACQIISPGK